MTKRGRPSTASLTVVPVDPKLPGERLAPPSDLTKAQAAVWRSVVASRPSDWFGPDSEGLLISYCRHTASANVLARRLDECESASDFDLELYGELLKLRERETRAITALARSMRLTQQSRYGHRAASTAAANAAGITRRPWEVVT